jgi:hypothetical protein
VSNELESCYHLFCGYVVASNTWSDIKRVLGINFPSTTVVDISSLWNNKKKNSLMNMVNATILRIILLTRNVMVFNRTHWFGM